MKVQVSQVSIQKEFNKFKISGQISNLQGSNFQCEGWQHQVPLVGAGLRIDRASFQPSIAGYIHLNGLLGSLQTCNDGFAHIFLFVTSIVLELQGWTLLEYIGFWCIKASQVQLVSLVLSLALQANDSCHIVYSCHTISQPVHSCTSL